MIPIRDDNPTQRRAVVTLLLIAANVFIYFGIQPDSTNAYGQQGGDAERFAFEYAAIPCEVVEGRPLEVGEIERTLRGDQTSCNEAQPSQPFFPDKSPWLALLYSMFFHGSLLHLGGNMLFLWVFGNNIEDRLGAARYVAFYVAAGIAAAIAHIAVQPDSTVPIIGASGAIAGVMGAYLAWFPNTPIRTLLMFIFITIVDIRAKWLLGFWFIEQFFVSPNSGVAWMAHVGGFVFGFVVALLLRPLYQRGRPARAY